LRRGQGEDSENSSRRVGRVEGIRNELECRTLEHLDEGEGDGREVRETERRSMRVVRLYRKGVTAGLEDG